VANGPVKVELAGLAQLIASFQVYIVEVVWSAII
jgi:hypothetical protein